MQLESKKKCSVCKERLVESNKEQKSFFIKNIYSALLNRTKLTANFYVRKIANHSRVCNLLSGLESLFVAVNKNFHLSMHIKVWRVRLATNRIGNYSKIYGHKKAESVATMNKKSSNRSIFMKTQYFIASRTAKGERTDGWLACVGVHKL